MSPVSSRLKLALSRLPAIALIAMLIFKILDGSYIYANALMASDPASAHTVEVHIHGRSIFITHEQSERLGLWHWTNFIIAALGALAIAKKVRSNQEPDSN